MATRRVNPYFVTTKWVFDRASRTRAAKAFLVLSHLSDRLLASPLSYDEWSDLTPEANAALEIIEAAGKRVRAADDEAQRAAKAIYTR